MSDFDTLYNSLIEILKAQGLNVDSLQKGDQAIRYRSADDIVTLLNYLKSEKSSETATVRTVAKNVRPTI